MSAFLTKAKEQVLMYWLIVAYVIMFSLCALCSAVLGSLIGTDWKVMETQGKVMIGLAVFVNTVLLAFFNRAVSRLQSGGLPIAPDDTTLISRTQVTKTVDVSTAPTQSPGK